MVSQISEPCGCRIICQHTGKLWVECDCVHCDEGFDQSLAIRYCSVHASAPELAKDKERLDFIAKTPMAISCSSKNGSPYHWIADVYEHEDGVTREDLREAIDAAMAAVETPPRLAENKNTEVNLS